MTTEVFDEFLRIFETFRANPAPAYFHIDGDLSYAELYAAALALSSVLEAHDPDGCRTPVIIYGHKDRRYPIAYWASILTGRPFIPIEPEVPILRIQRISDLAGVSIMLDATRTASAPRCNGVLTLPVPTAALPISYRLRQIPRVAPNETMYIMFSSGTSGQPKGIRISYENVLNFLVWLQTLFGNFGSIEAVTGNVRFSFDISLFELWTSWLQAKPLSALDHAEFFNTRKYIERFRKHRVTTWVSTPTMMRRYLADPCFRGSELPKLNTFLFCGEVLPKHVVVELWNRFDGCRVFNTYGPTECTVAVTGVRILPTHVSAACELPIGYARTGTHLDLRQRQPDAPRGEIIIRGNAVGPGYLNLPDRQALSFPAPETYRTGDWGRMEADGLWYFEGRMDREYKVGGSRIDLNEVEAHIRQMPGVIDVVADVYWLKGEPRAISVFVLGPTHTSQLCHLAQEMARELPAPFVPRFWYGVLEPALNDNGKLKRSEMKTGSNQTGVRYVYSHGAGDSQSHRTNAG